MSLLFTPSIKNRLLVTLLPLTEKSTPPSRPFFSVLKNEAGETPGASCVNSTKLLPFNGSSRTSLPSTTLPTAPVFVSTWMALASTVTSSLTLPTWRTAFTVVVVEASSSTCLLINVLKFGCLIVTSSVPTGNSGTVEQP